jgi:hypothetical protein
MHEALGHAILKTLRNRHGGRSHDFNATRRGRVKKDVVWHVGVKAVPESRQRARPYLR